MGEEASKNRREEEEIEYKGALIKIQPQFSEQFLFRGMQSQVSEDVRMIEEVLREELKADEVRKQPVEFGVIVHYLLRNYTSTLLGQIVHPIHGRVVIRDRIVQIAETLLMVVERKYRKIMEQIEEGRIPPTENLREEIERILRLHTTAMLAIRESVNRLQTLHHINAPPTQRPPLANTKIGYELG